MADKEIDESDVKEEELVDFEGSDYGFDSEEELEIEQQVFGIRAVDSRSPESADVQELSRLQEQDIDDCKEDGQLHSCYAAEEANAAGGEISKIEEFNPEHGRIPSESAHLQNKEGAESGEIEEEREEDKDEGVVVQPFQNSHSNREAPDVPDSVEKTRRQRKADLEDGELDDTVMPEGVYLEAQKKHGEDESIGRERKRRKDRFIPEKLSKDPEEIKAKEFHETDLPVFRRQRVRGSDRLALADRSAGFSNTGGGRGFNMHMIRGFGPARLAPGIMGPGRPFLPTDLGSAIGLRPFGRGFGGPSLRGFTPPGRPTNQIQEALAQEQLLVQEHILRSHRAMQLAHGNTPGGVRPPMTGPLGPAALGPLMGLDFAVPGPHGVMQPHHQGPEIMDQMNFVGPRVDRFVRGQRPDFMMARGVKNMDQTGSSPGNGLGRQGFWSSLPMVEDTHAAGRGRGHGRGNTSGPVWGDAQAVGPFSMGQGGVGEQMDINQTVHNGSTARDVQGNEPGMQIAGTNKLRQGGRSASALEKDGNTGSSKVDVKWKLESKRNGITHNLNVEASKLTVNSGGSCINDDKHAHEKSQILGMAAQVIPVATGNVPSSNSTSGGNVIRLLHPVPKSRILTVSGLPETTPMSAIVEVFEKQGRITDFRKDEKANMFTITFSNEFEAVSAKRHLHRSFLAGKQITVEYNHQ